MEDRSVKLKVMTFNIRVEARVDGINYLDNRREKILKTIKDESPDLIGFQEASDRSRVWLRDSLDDYFVMGCGRNKDYSGEGVPLAFRKDRFEMIGMETFWLSCTPNIPESRYVGSDQSGCPRIATAVILKPSESQELLLFINTHTDHEGSVSRMLASAQLIGYISEKQLPTVLTGDFNASPDAAEITMMTSNKYFPLIDATALVGGTFHGFGKFSDKESIKIDYIFTNLPTDSNESYAVKDAHEGGIYISDHRPVVAFVEI